MAVSRGKMLGHYSRGPGGYKCPCCDEPNVTRWRKRVEAREVAREIAEGIVELSDDEGRAMFDAQCREHLGISGAEFLRRWDAGEYKEARDRCDYDIVELSMLIPFAR